MISTGRGYGPDVRVGAACRAVVLLVLLGGTAPSAVAQDPEDLGVRWGDDYASMRLVFLGQQQRYPDSVVGGTFPPAGAPPQIKFESGWPAVAMHARWTASTRGWPAADREQALDFVLMRACDVEAYEHVYPEIVRTSRVTFPPEYLKEAENPQAYELAQAMRGKYVAYEIVAKGGRGASDYDIKTRIRIGLSADGNTLFYHDNPRHISKNLKNRETIVVAHDAGDRIHFEVRALYVCTPRRLLRGEVLRRVEKSSRYLVERMYSYLSDAPTAGELQDYYRLVKNREQPLDAVVDVEPQHAEEDQGSD